MQPWYREYRSGGVCNSHHDLALALAGAGVETTTQHHPFFIFRILPRLVSCRLGQEDLSFNLERTVKSLNPFHPGSYSKYMAQVLIRAETRSGSVCASSFRNKTGDLLTQILMDRKGSCLSTLDMRRYICLGWSCRTIIPSTKVPDACQGTYVVSLN